MRNFYFSILLYFLIKPCLLFAEEQHEYTIIGTLPDSIDNVYVYLAPMDLFGNSTLKDSTLVHKGRFSFNGIVDVPKNVYSISSIEYPAIAGMVVIESGNILYNYQDNADKGYAYAKGTYLNDCYTDSILIPSMQIVEFGEKIMNGKIDIRNPEITEKEKELVNEMRNKTQMYYKYMPSFIRRNIDNQVGEYVFLSSAMIFIQLKTDVSDILPKLSDNVRKKYEEMYNAMMNVMNPPQVPVGQQYIPFRGKTLDNEYLVLSDIIKQKKLVLLDFWASWCAPCIKEMPVIAQLYNDYKEKGLEIIGVSSDENERSWRNSVQKHNLSWLQVISKTGESDDIGKLYGVVTIPHTVLINSKGEVVATQLRGQELIDKVKEILE